MDILFFFGPILIVLCYRGIKLLKEDSRENENSSLKYFLIISALLALLILFLAGAPKKGETARICMFILPILIIPVIKYLLKEGYPRVEKAKLLILIFSQAIIMQIIAIYVW